MSGLSTTRLDEPVALARAHPSHRRRSLWLRGYWDALGCGLGLAVVTRRDDIGPGVGAFGWDGGLGTTWHSDPREDMTTIIMTQRACTSPNPPPVCRDFWTAAYGAIDD